MAKKSAREKLESSHHLPQLKQAPEKWGGGKMLIPHPQDLQALMKQVRKGRLTTSTVLREILADVYGADICCPMVTGIFQNLVAAAAFESEQEGKKRITPYWRTLRKDGELNPKYPGGLDAHRAALENEGHRVTHKGRKFYCVVEDSELFRPSLTTACHIAEF